MRENSEFSAELAEPAKTLPVMTAPARVGRPASDRWLHNGTEKDRTRDRPRILQELQLYGNWPDDRISTAQLRSLICFAKASAQRNVR
jgi:hypothetical protein